MKLYIAYIDCDRDVPTKAFLGAENLDIAYDTANAQFGQRYVVEVLPLIQEAPM